MPVPQPATASPLPDRSAVRRGVLAAILRVKPSLAAESLEDRQRFDELGVPSITLVAILFEIEETFDIEIVGTDLDGIETIGGLTNRVHRRLVEQGRAA